MNDVWGSGSTYSLADGRIDIWRVMLPLPQSVMSKLNSSLSVDEQKRRDSYSFIKQRHTFIASRGILRDIVARYIDARPSDIVFSSTRWGKPYLQDADISFSLSHSGDCIIYAITHKGRVGIDIELMRSDIRPAQLAQRVCSYEEYEQLMRGKSEQEQLTNFYRCWTRKEAYAKAISMGLQAHAQSIDVGCLPQKSIFSVDGIVQWTLEDITVLPGYSASLVSEYKYHILKRMNWR